MTRCKVGDMAVLIDDPDFHEEGIIVEVLRYAPERDGTPAWTCRTKDGRRMRCWTLGGLLPWLSSEVDILDECLQPIRGLPRHGETETHRPAALGVPREELVCAVSHGAP